MEKEKAKMKIKRKRVKDEENNEGEIKKISRKRDHINKTKEKEKENKIKKRKKKEMVTAPKVVEEKCRKGNNKKNNNCLASSSLLPSSSKKLASLGVFDFPWLKDGVMSKTEECSSFLDYCGEESFLISSSFYEEASSMANVLPQDKLIMEDLWQPFESDDGLNLNLDASNDDLDCIWTSLLNKPL